MIRAKTLLAAEQIIVDRFSGKVSAITIFRDMKGTFPTAMSAMFYVELDKDGSDATDGLKAEIRLNKELIASKPITFNFAEENTAKGVVSFGIFPILAPGNLKFRIINNEDELISREIKLKPASPEQTTIAI